MSTKCQKHTFNFANRTSANVYIEPLQRQRGKNHDKRDKGAIAAGTTEGSYDPATATRGVDTLIKSVETNSIGRNANVYAELDLTWRFVMRDRLASMVSMSRSGVERLRPIRSGRVNRLIGKWRTRLSRLTDLRPISNMTR